MYRKNRTLTTLIFALLSVVLSACNETKHYHLLYPIEASKQEVLRIQGYRFLSSTLASPASILVLSNPVENGGFADFALAITNNSDTPLSLSEKDLVIKMSRQGTLKMLSPQEYSSSKVYARPDGFERLSPQMQAFGCAAANTEDNIRPAAFNASQSWVWEQHLRYPFKKEELYLETLEIPSGATKGVLFRVSFPELAEDFEQATVLVHLNVTHQEEYKFKFILQSLQ
jgi:hypothetical protein